MEANLVYDQDEYYEPEESVASETITEVRAMFYRLKVGDSIQYEIRTEENAPAELTIVGLTELEDGNGVRRELKLRGPKGGIYYLTDHPKDNCPHAISVSEHGWGTQGPVMAIKLLSGE